MKFNLSIGLTLLLFVASNIAVALVSSQRLAAFFGEHIAASHPSLLVCFCNTVKTIFDVSGAGTAPPCCAVAV